MYLCVQKACLPIKIVMFLFPHPTEGPVLAYEMFLIHANSLQLMYYIAALSQQQVVPSSLSLPGKAVREVTQSSTPPALPLL